MRLYLTPKNIGLISRLLQLQLSELFRTLTQASSSLLVLKGWEIKEREPFTGSTYETWFEPFSLKVYPYKLWLKTFTLNKETPDVNLGKKSVANLSKKISASFKATNQLSICWKGKRYVRRCCEKKQR